MNFLSHTFWICQRSTNRPGFVLHISVLLIINHVLWPCVGFVRFTPRHVLDALCPVVLIVTVTGDVLQVVHVGSYQHGSQLYKVAVRRVLHCTQDRMNVRVNPDRLLANQNWERQPHSCNLQFRAAYPLQCPRGRLSLSLYDLELLPQCCYQSQQTACSPASQAAATEERFRFLMSE